MVALTSCPRTAVADIVLRMICTACSLTVHEECLNKLSNTGEPRDLPSGQRANWCDCQHRPTAKRVELEREG